MLTIQYNNCFPNAIFIITILFFNYNEPFSWDVIIGSEWVRSRGGIIPYKELICMFMLKAGCT